MRCVMRYAWTPQFQFSGLLFIPILWLGFGLGFERGLGLGLGLGLVLGLRLGLGLALGLGSSRSGLDDHFRLLRPIDLNLNFLGICHLDHESRVNKNT